MNTKVHSGDDLERREDRFLTGDIFPWFIHFWCPFACPVTCFPGAPGQSHLRRVRSLPGLCGCVGLLGGKYEAPSEMKSYPVEWQQHLHPLFPPLDGYSLANRRTTEQIMDRWTRKDRADHSSSVVSFEISQSEQDKCCMISLVGGI